MTVNGTSHMSRRQRQRMRSVVDELAAALRHEPTRKTIRVILDMCGVYNPNTPADRRAVGLELIELIGQVGEHEYVNLMREAADELVQLKLEAQKESRNVD